MAIAKFRSGEGVIHEADESSVAFELMSKGGFVRLDDEPAEPEQPAGPAGKVPIPKKPKAPSRAKAAGKVK